MIVRDESPPSDPYFVAARSAWRWPCSGSSWAAWSPWGRRTGTIEGVTFVSYLFTALLVLPVGAALALVERSRWGTGVLLVALLAVAACGVRGCGRCGRRWLARRSPSLPSGEVDLASGPGRILIAVYGVFAVGRDRPFAGPAGDRTPTAAPLAYGLSLLAAVVYLVATTCLLLGGRRARLVAIVACTVEAVGVVVVGTLSALATDLFPDRTVWSHFGQGYGFLPLVLPIAGLAWLRHSSPSPRGVRVAFA